jgi:hypothetical protein
MRQDSREPFMCSMPALLQESPVAARFQATLEMSVTLIGSLASPVGTHAPRFEAWNKRMSYLPPVGNPGSIQRVYIVSEIELPCVQLA